jgi:hypothetical protein
LVVPLRRAAIRDATPELLDLAESLRDPQGNDVRGVALVSVLLSDAILSPLYVSTGESLRERVTDAIEALWAPW